MQAQRTYTMATIRTEYSFFEEAYWPDSVLEEEQRESNLFLLEWDNAHIIIIFHTKSWHFTETLHTGASLRSVVTNLFTE